MRAFEQRLLSAVSSLVTQVSAEIRGEMCQRGQDAVDGAMRNVYGQMVRTADAAERSYEHVKQIGSAMQSIQQEVSELRAIAEQALKEAARARVEEDRHHAELADLRKEFLALRREHEQRIGCVVNG